MKIAAGFLATAVLALVASAAYTAWLNVVEERQMQKVQPLLGVTYAKNHKR